MKNWMGIAVLLLFVPVIASAQFRDLDMAMSNLSRGFGGGDAQAIVAGIASGDQVNLQFPGLVDNSGFFGRDQAALLLDGLFNRVRPNNFQQTNAKKVSAENQYHIRGTWAINVGGKTEERDLYIILRTNGDRWSLMSVRATGK